MQQQHRFKHATSPKTRQNSKSALEVWAEGTCKSITSHPSLPSRVKDSISQTRKTRKVKVGELAAQLKVLTTGLIRCNSQFCWTPRHAWRYELNQDHMRNCQALTLKKCGEHHGCQTTTASPSTPSSSKHLYYWITITLAWGVTPLCSTLRTNSSQWWYSYEACLRSIAAESLTPKYSWLK